MDNWLKIGLILACFGVFASILAYFWFFIGKLARSAREQAAAIEALAKWQADFNSQIAAEQEKEHARLSSQGQKGAQIREENREMRAAAMSEGRALFASPAPLEQKKAALIQLAMKYPRVAEEVTNSLIRELKLEPYGDIIKGVIAQALQGQAARGEQQESAEGYL